MYDVLIVGGGPAGATLGSYLSKAGIKNLILEGHNQPRPHVGESLVLSIMRIFGELGLIDTMDRSDFPKKYGAAWCDFNGKEPALHFSEFRQKGIDRDHTYHVDRSNFDKYFERFFGDAEVRKEWFTQTLQLAMAAMLTNAYENFVVQADTGLEITARHYKISLLGEEKNLILITLQKLQPYPEVPQSLQRLRETGLRLAILTNSTVSAAEAQLALHDWDVTGALRGRCTADFVARPSQVQG